MRLVPAAILGVVAIAAGCAAPAAIRNDDLKVGDDTSSEGKEGKEGDATAKQTGSTELGDGTPGTDPNANDPPRVAGCHSNDQCPTNQVCTNGQCDFANASVECTFDADCDLGTICVSSACKAGCYTDGDCPTGQACTSGMCKAAADGGTPPGAVTCSSDGACNPGNNGAGMICSAEGVCVSGCHTDAQCPGLQICTSGTCR